MSILKKKLIRQLQLSNWEGGENVVEVGAMHIKELNDFPVEDFLEYRLLIIYELLKEQRILRLVIIISIKLQKNTCKLIS